MSRHGWGWRGGEAASGGAQRLERTLRRLEEWAGTPHREEAPGGGITGEFSPPARPDAIAEAELRLGTALPADYVAFLLRHDGARFQAAHLAPGSSHFSAELLGTEALAQQAEEMEYDYPAWCIPELVIFATVGDDGDRLAFETGRMNPYGGCGVLDARHNFRPDQWWVIARDFTAWLEALLAERGSLESFGRGDPAALELQPPLPLPDGPGAR